MRRKSKQKRKDSISEVRKWSRLFAPAELDRPYVPQFFTFWLANF